MSEDTSPRPASVAVVGSLHYDIMVDAPNRPRKGETLVGHAWRPKCGGKGGNQAVAAARAGAAVAMVGAVGPDAFGETLLAHLDDAGVMRDHVAVRAGSASGMSVAISDAEGDYGAVIVSAVNLALDAEAVAAAGGVIDGAEVLVLQNEVPEAVNVAAALRAAAAGTLVILNAAPARASPVALTRLVDLLVVNAVEAEMLGAGAVGGRSEALAAAVALLDGFRAAVVTAGGAGLAYADRAGARLVVEPLRVTVVSTHGAGDAFVGTLAARLAEGIAIEPALHAANEAAARLVGGLG